MPGLFPEVVQLFLVKILTSYSCIPAPESPAKESRRFLCRVPELSLRAAFFSVVARPAKPSCVMGSDSCLCFSSKVILLFFVPYLPALLFGATKAEIWGYGPHLMYFLSVKNQHCAKCPSVFECACCTLQCYSCCSRRGRLRPITSPWGEAEVCVTVK